MVRIGEHISISKGAMTGIKQTLENGSTCFQIFVKNPRSFSDSKISDKVKIEVKDFTEEHNIKFVSHSPYILNLSKDPSDNKLAFDTLINDIKTSSTMGAIGSVVHMGKYLKSDPEIAYANMAQSIKLILDQIDPSEYNGKLIIENSAHQGTEIGYDINGLIKLWKLIPDDCKHRVGICFDTCHAFAGGLDLTKYEEMDKYLNLFNDEIGLENLVCIHLNDSMKPCNCRVDRHQNLGFGEIGLNSYDGMKLLIQRTEYLDIPIILETPYDKEKRIQEIKMVKSWV